MISRTESRPTSSAGPPWSSCTADPSSCTRSTSPPSRRSGAVPASGHRPRPAANYDIALSDAFWHAMTGLVHAFALATAEGIAAADASPTPRGPRSCPTSSTGRPGRSAPVTTPATAPKRSSPPGTPPGRRNEEHFRQDHIWQERGRAHQRHRKAPALRAHQGRPAQARHRPRRPGPLRHEPRRTPARPRTRRAPPPTRFLITAQLPRGSQLTPPTGVSAARPAPRWN
ncbi:hypothetical protein [Kitasatospora sp. NPDC050543]|uniref:imine reductase family protein n=1 Tax=Kitasatospora sp. NPDC050543 TaxID=3364054 RepID=UPI0037930634